MICAVSVLIFVNISLHYSRMLVAKGRIDYKSVAKYCRAKFIRIGIGTGIIIAFIIITLLISCIGI